MADHLSLGEMRAIVSNEDTLAERAFELLGELSTATMLSGDDEDSRVAAAREIAIRMLEHREALAGLAPLLDSVLRQLGLFPYADQDSLSMRELLELEANRPAGLDNELVFHRVQAYVYRRLLDGENVVLSAPTSFGKSLIIDALIASGSYANVVIVVPTIALIDETRRRLSRRFGREFRVITHVGQAQGERNLFVLTQERVLDHDGLPKIDLFVIDEFYKLASTEDPERGRLLNLAFLKLHRRGGQFYFLGPNVNGLAPGLPASFRGTINFVRTDYCTVAVDVEFVRGGEDPHAKLAKICARLAEPSLIYCASPNSARKVTDALLAGDVNAHHSAQDRAVEWVGENFHAEWQVTRALARGIGIHHGRLPRALAHYMVRAFDEGAIRFLVCTSTLIEGVNTRAKNVIVFDKKIARKNFDYFTYKNITGRSGRMSQHYVGRVFLFNDPPAEKLPDVDIPVLSQPGDTATSLLVQLTDEELTERSRARLAQALDTDALSLAVVRDNVGVDIERQLSLARVLRTMPEDAAGALAWSGSPNGEQLQAVCELIWDHLADGPSWQHGVASAKQLAFKIGRLRDGADPRTLIDYELKNDWRREHGHDVDRIVDDVLDFLRHWPGHAFPRLLHVVDRIQREALSSRGLATGDYSVFGAQVESLFLPTPLAALEEYGVPLQLAARLSGNLRPDGDLDALLARLRNLDIETVDVKPFERELLADAQESL
jgi:DEAD/DEAH box helicase/Helicase conserved C-terminal domain